MLSRPGGTRTPAPAGGPRKHCARAPTPGASPVADAPGSPSLPRFNAGVKQAPGFFVAALPLPLGQYQNVLGDLFRNGGAMSLSRGWQHPVVSRRTAIQAGAVGLLGLGMD